MGNSSDQPTVAFDRRQFAGVMAGLALLSTVRAERKPPTQCQHIAAEVTAEPVDLPKGTRLPFRWSAAGVSSEPTQPVRLKFESDQTAGTPTALRFSIGLETRDVRQVTATSIKSKKKLGTFDVRFSSPFQLYSIDLNEQSGQIALSEGVQLQLTRGELPLMILTDGNKMPDALRPHLLVPGSDSPDKEFFRRFASVASIQPFGWMQGCVFDGLLDMADAGQGDAYREAADRQFELFLPGGKLVYENPRGMPVDGRVYGIEDTLPYAALARIEPDHAVLEIPIKFWKSRQDKEGCIIDGGNTTSEGSYTVGYPLAVIGRARKSDELEKMALAQIRVRQDRLFDGKTFWRTRNTKGGRGNKNWSRGIAWQILGMARTMSVLADRDEVKALIPEFKKLADWTMAYQRPNGLWGVFVDDTKTIPDTAGSAGLAAALAIGYREKWLDKQAAEAADKAIEGLKTYLTPDGFMDGVSQGNKGGEALQRGNYRVIYQIGMGLLAQTIAARTTRPE